jgi:hypothetical protein
LLIIAPWCANAATAALTVADVVAPSEGNSISVPILISAPPEHRVAALQFDVEFDPSALTLPSAAGVVEGAAAKAAGKQVSFSKTSPGKVRVLVVGFNEEVIANGEVAKINFSMARQRMQALEPISLRNVVLSDPNGVEIAVKSGNGGLRLAPGPTTSPAPATTTSGRYTPDPRAITTVVAGCLLIGGTAAGMAWRRRAHGKRRVQSERKPAAAHRSPSKHT